MPEFAADSASANEVDHVVINCLHDLDAACQVFAGLGFSVSARGHHSLGSMNHLIMTEGPYLELVGVPRDGLQRADVVNSPFGLSGLVLRSHDADETYESLRARSLAMLPPLYFSRPVTVGGETRDARFRIVRAEPGQFLAGRIYCCQHLTPELVWKGEGVAHSNGFLRLVAIRVGSTNLPQDARLYEALTSTTGVIQQDCVSFQLSGVVVDLMPDKGDQFTSLALEFAELPILESAALKMTGVEWRRVSSDIGILTIPALSLRLDCISKKAGT